MDRKFLTVIGVFLLSTSVSDGGGCGDVVEENDELVVLCRVPSNEYSLYWYVTTNHTTTNVARCSKRGWYSPITCVVMEASPYLAIEYGNHKNGSTSTPFLKVLRVPREMTQVKCVPQGRGSYVNTCNVTVVVPPYDSSCVSFNTKSADIFQLTCKFKVYPKGTCRLSPQIRPSIANIKDVEITYNHQSLKGRPLYLTTCTIHGTVRNIQQPTSYRVEFTPTVNNSQQFSRLSDWITPRGSGVGASGDIATTKKVPMGRKGHNPVGPKGQCCSTRSVRPSASPVRTTTVLSPILQGPRHESYTTFTFVVTTVVAICLAIVFIAVVILVIIRKMRTGNAGRESQGPRSSGPANERSRNQRIPHVRPSRSQQYRSACAIREPFCDVRNKSTHSSIVNTNDVTQPADIPVESSRLPSYDTAIRQTAVDQRREGTQYNVHRSQAGDKMNELPPPYPGK